MSLDVRTDCSPIGLAMLAVGTFKRNTTHNAFLPLRQVLQCEEMVPPPKKSYQNLEIRKVDLSVYF